MSRLCQNVLMAVSESLISSQGSSQVWHTIKHYKRRFQMTPQKQNLCYIAQLFSLLIMKLCFSWATK